MQLYLLHLIELSSFTLFPDSKTNSLITDELERLRMAYRIITDELDTLILLSTIQYKNMLAKRPRYEGKKRLMSLVKKDI